MNIDHMLDSFRKMNHLIELDEDHWPILENTEWSEGWVRFHDTLNNSLLCVNEDDPDNTTQEEVGEVLIMSGDDYCTCVSIPPKQMVKFIKAETMKSNMLETSINLKKSYL